MKKIISIEGMSCGHCVNAVENALRAVPGVRDVAVALASHTATVEAENAVTEEQLKKAVTHAGYQVAAIR